jgi:NAD(P)-dependent dehydrogenase (short-subunit alcohol dehydrogenase family)
MRPAACPGYAEEMKKAIIAGIDSSLGSLIANHLASKEWEILGTSRRIGLESDKYQKEFKISNCDFSSSQSIDKCVSEILAIYRDWDVLILAIGVLEPIGEFKSSNFEEWQSSFSINFLGQMRFIQKLLMNSSDTADHLVLTFAGGGTNGPTPNFSSYTLAKIALIKAMELLASEIPTSKFISLGTGWMDTPIHAQTLEAGPSAGDAYFETLKRIETNNFGRSADLLNFVDWAISADKEITSGRNFSLQGDPWSCWELSDELKKDTNMFKLRRFRNYGGKEVADD